MKAFNFKFNLKYDHNQFPGVVPRTFIGALLVSILSAPLAYTLYGLTVNIFLIQLAGKYLRGREIYSTTKKVITFSKHKHGLRWEFW
jgi:alpha-1,6-mannosyltransferase